jgi:hypothetical protein
MRNFAKRLAAQLLIGLIMLLLAPSLALGQNTAKISGRVTAEDGEPLPGANVRIEGEGYGAATGPNGEYTIFEVPPGTYTVVASFVGYQTERRQNVQLVSGVTRRLDFELQEAEFEGEELVVTATKPLVNPTATNAVRSLDREELENLPTREPETYYSIQPGVTVQNGEVHIRGGRSDETDFQLEGISSRSLLGANNVVPVIPEALQETQVFAGGYSADQGGANAGIVQQTLRTGGTEYSGMAQWEGDQVGNGFGDTESYGNQDAVVTLGGPLYWDQHRFFVAANYRETDNVRPDFWSGGALNQRAGEEGLCSDVPQEGCHPPVDDVRGDTAVAPLQWEDGELPGIGQPREEWRINGTLKFDFSPLTFRLSYAQVSRDQRVNSLPIQNFYNGERLPKREDVRRLVSLQPKYFLSENTYLDATAGFFQFNTETFDPLLGPAEVQDEGGRLLDILAYEDRQAVAEALGVGTDDQSLEENRFTRFWQGRFQDPPLYRFNGFRFTRPGENQTQYSRTEQSYYTGSLSLVSQQGNHELQVGGDFKRWTVREYGLSTSILSSNRRGNPDYEDAIRGESESIAFDIRSDEFSDIYGYDEFGREVDSGPDGSKHPLTASAWINDKIEFEDIILNLGLRYNYFDMDQWEPADLQNPPYDVGDQTVKVGGELQVSEDETVPGLQETDADQNLLPRVGLSFPISDRTAFHLQYGKFSQMPDMSRAYAGRNFMALVFQGGNFVSSPFAFDLDPIKTTQYEIGFGHQFADFASFDITAFYRRTEDQLQINGIETISASPAEDYNLFQNGDFSITRGFELSVRSRRFGGVQAIANYTLSDAKGTNSEPSGQVSAIENNLPTPSQVQPLEFMQRHQGSGILDYRTGTSGPRWANNISVNLLFRFSSGHRFTRATGGLGQRGADDGALLPDSDPRNRTPLEAVNSSSTPFTSTLDLRIKKGFTLGPASATAYIYFQNLLNEKNVLNVYRRTGNANDDGFLSNPELSEDIVANRGQDYVDYYRAINLQNRQHWWAEGNGNESDLFGEPRQVRLGIEVSF